MKWKPIFIAAIITGLVVSCNKNSEDTTEDSASTNDVLVQALAEGAGQASSTEGGTAAIASSINTMAVLEEEIQYAKKTTESLVANDRVAESAANCKFSARTCSSTTGTITWSGCSIPGPKASLTMTGGWTETWTDPGDCTNGYLSVSNSVTRKTTSSVISYPGGATVTTDTNGGNAWDGTAIAAGGIIQTRANTFNRNISVTPANSGIHKVMIGRRGAKLFDYFSVPSLTITGSHTNGSGNGLSASGSNRSLGGTVTIYHNQANYTAVNTFNAVAWGDATCCFPTTGSISTTFSGTSAPTGPITLTFSTSCGTANLATPDNTAGTSIDLINCQ